MATKESNTSSTLTVVIVAAGTGSRFGSSLPKQFCLLDRRPVVMHAIERIRSLRSEAKITLVISAQMVEFWHELCRDHNFLSPDIVIGGATRWESVHNALTSPLQTRDGIVMIHDAARPLISGEVLDRLEAAVKPGTGAVPAISLADSIRQVGDGTNRAVDRSAYRAVQTPQTFVAAELIEAYRAPYRATFTDDASVYEAAGGSIALVEGDAALMKITRPLDIEIATLYLKK